ncbi:type I 3-dehydroquinate dehydratase [Candidatus Bathyarchaeota archaeon]|nr:type I 3-dehydroquinate dehydratase [Candidatus Bathyarchaeota archaeon]
MRPKICAVIAERELSEALNLIEEAENQRADLLEVRLDYLREHPPLDPIFKATKLPIIATCRLKDQGGMYTGPEETRKSLLLKAADAGASYVDIELKSKQLRKFITQCKSLGVKLIISHHDCVATPSLKKLNSIFKSELRAGADIGKIVTTAQQFEDNLTCLNFQAELSRKHVAGVCFAMGTLGRISRILSPIYGGSFAYASVKFGGETAAGQLTIQEMQKIYAMLGVT